MKKFGIKKKIFAWIMLILLLLILPVWYQKGVFEGFGGGVAIVVIGIMIGYQISLISYRFIIFEDGKIIEKQWFYKTREIMASEIEWIRFRAYSSNPALAATPNASVAAGVSAPRILNQKYENFPRYAISSVIIDEIKKVYPEVKLN